jgi:hypothetical protein
MEIQGDQWEGNVEKEILHSMAIAFMRNLVRVSYGTEIIRNFYGFDIVRIFRELAFINF